MLITLDWIGYHGVMKTSNQTLFLDTTIQADKCLSHKKKRETIVNSICNKTLMSSTWVLGEFKSTFLDDAVTLHNLLFTSPTISEALLRSEKYRDRIHKRMIKLFGNLCKDDEFGKNGILDRLDILIEYMLEVMFFEGISQPLVNKTNCYKANAKATRVGDTWSFAIRCRKRDKKQCRIDEFMEYNKENLKLFVESTDILESKDIEIKKYKTTITKILSGDSPKGNNCKSLGDVIIALECPKRCSIFTTNIKHFELICPIFKKKIYTL